MIECFRNGLVILVILKVNNSSLVPSSIIMSKDVIITTKKCPRNNPNTLTDLVKPSKKSEPNGLRDWGYFIDRWWPGGRTARGNISTVPARNRFDIVNNVIILKNLSVFANSDEFSPSFEKLGTINS